jgi:hypothetical protein
MENGHDMEEGGHHEEYEYAVSTQDTIPERSGLTSNDSPSLWLTRVMITHSWTLIDA